jgi:uncharacterized BrkB/YihY/UPF0761 family membrane protein
VTRRYLIDLAWGLALFGLIVAILVLGTSGPKFIYIDF